MSILTTHDEYGVGGGEADGKLFGQPHGELLGELQRVVLRQHDESTIVYPLSPALHPRKGTSLLIEIVYKLETSD